jgi:hypothetical protein
MFGIEVPKLTKKETFRVMILAIMFSVFGFGVIFIHSISQPAQTRQIEREDLSASIFAVGGLALTVKHARKISDKEYIEDTPTK